MEDNFGRFKYTKLVVTIIRRVDKQQFTTIFERMYHTTHPFEWIPVNPKTMKDLLKTDSILEALL